MTTEELFEFDWSRVTTPVKNYLGQYRDRVLSRMHGSDEEGNIKPSAALGRYKTRALANQMYQQYQEWAASTGVSNPDTNQNVAQYIGKVYAPYGYLAKLQTHFPVLS